MVKLLHKAKKPTGTRAKIIELVAKKKEIEVEIEKLRAKDLEEQEAKLMARIAK